MKKILSWALVLAMVITSFSFVYADVTGSGTAEDPYLIYTWKDFNQIDNNVANTAGKYYKLMADIDVGANFADNTQYDGNVALEPSASVGTTVDGTIIGFQGVFDGNGHKFYNYAIDNWSSNTMPAGLFNVISGDAVVKNLGIENVVMVIRQGCSGSAPGGALVGRVEGAATIDNCYVKNVRAYVTLSGSEYQVCGGMIGKVAGADVTVKNCYAQGTNIGNTSINHNGELIGLIEAVAEIRNCYAQGRLGKMVSSLTAAKLENNYVTLDPVNANGGDWWGDNAHYKGTVVSEDDLKAKTAELGAAYGTDAGNVNNGFPVLLWENGAQAVTGTNAYLKDVTVSAGELKFDSTKYAYTMVVDNKVDKITVDAVKADAAATVTGEVTDKELVVGNNTITLSVTSSDATVTKDYVITITREEDPAIEGLEGLGTEEKPVLISSCDDWMKFVNALNADEKLTATGKHYKLTADLDFSSYEGTFAHINSFSAHLDGNKHIISNIKVGGDVRGLIYQALPGSVIENLGVKDVTFTGVSDANYGAIAGRSKTSTMKNCFVSGIKDGGSNSAKFGALVGIAFWANGTNGCEIENSYAVSKLGEEGYVDSSSNYAGLIGSISADTMCKINITNCYSDIVGLATPGVSGATYNVTNSYYIGGANTTGSKSSAGTEITANDLRFAVSSLGSAFKYAPDMDNNLGFPKLAWESDAADTDEGLDATTAPALIAGLEGAGSEASPVLIKTCADWETFAEATIARQSSDYFEGYYFKLDADLDFAEYQWKAGKVVNAGHFRGIFDGGYHVISNYTITANNKTNDTYPGLFYRFGGSKTQSIVKNLGMEDVIFDTASLSNWKYPGSLVGCCNSDDKFKIENCYVSGIKTTGSNANCRIGGLIGYSHWTFKSTVENCYVVTKMGEEGYVTAADLAITSYGDIIGLFNGGTSYVYINNCYGDTNVLVPSGYAGWNNNEAYANSALATNSYYNSDCTLGFGSLGTGKTTTELKALAETLGSAYVEDAKYVNNGYPILAWQASRVTLSKNAALASLTVSSGDLTPKFSANTTAYTVYVKNDVDKITVAATAEDAAATVTGTVTDKELAVGDNTITVTVTAENGTTVKTYTVVVKRLAAGQEIPKLLPDEAPDDAILITSLEDLKSKLGGVTEGKYFVLTTDIDMKDEDWSSYIGSKTASFKGTFHGNNHVIRNFKMKNTGASDFGYGIFGYVGGDAVIKNLGVENVEIYKGYSDIAYSHSAAAGMIGFLQDNAKVESCFAKNVKIDTKVAAGNWAGFVGDQLSYAGGLIGGTAGNVQIINCYSLGFQELNDSSSSEGGLIGGMPEGTFASVKNCYSDTHLTTCTEADASKVQNSYATITSGWSSYGKRPGIAVTVTALKDSAGDLGDGFIADIMGLNDGFPMLAWEMTLTRLEGNGSEESPFIISNVDTLAQIASHRATAGKYYKLANDIDFEGAKLTTFVGKKAAPFEGVFDGAGHVIKNFVIEPTETGMSTQLGIFGYISGNAVIKDFGIENVTVSPEGEWGFNSCVGALVAVMDGNAKVENSYVKNMVFKNDSDAVYNAHTGGGLIGKMISAGTSVENCYAIGVKQEKNSVAMFSGLVGTALNYSSIKNCYSDSTLSMSPRKGVKKTTNSFRMADDNGTAYSRTGALTKEADLKAKAATLGAAFAEDTTSINGGFPVLSWQVPATVDPEPTPEG